MIEINNVIVEKFKIACNNLKKFLKKYQGSVAVREENHDTNFGIEYIFEIIISRLINEDNYGVVFSLTIKKQKFDDLKCVELSAIKGDGTFIELKEFMLKDNNSEFDTFIKEFEYSINHFSDKIERTIENEYV